MMGGIGTRIGMLKFTGTPSSGNSRLIRFGANSGTGSPCRDQEIGWLTVNPGAYINGIAHLNAPGSRILGGLIGSQGSTSTATAIEVQNLADRARLENIHFEAARSHAAIYGAVGTPKRVTQKGTTYTQHPTNPVTAEVSAAWTALTGKVEADNGLVT